MTGSDEEVLEVLKKVHDLLVPISACFEEQFAAIQRQRFGAKFEELAALLTPVRRAIFPLLFDSRHLSQVEIAKEANTTQPTVSRFINTLLAHGLIDQTEDETGTVVYVDKFDLVRLMEGADERD